MYGEPFALGYTHTYQSASRTQRGPCSQYGSAGHPFRSAHQQRMSVCSLMCITGTREDRPADERPVRIMICRSDLPFIFFAQTDRQHDELAGRLAALGQQQGEFGKFERQRHGGPDRLASRITEFGKHTRRQVDGNHTAPGRVDRPHRTQHRLRKRAVHAGSEHRIDDDRTGRNGRQIVLCKAFYSRRQTLQIAAAFFGQCISVEQHTDGARISGPVQDPGDSQSVATVVALADEKQQWRPLSDMRYDPPGYRLGSPFHQVEARDRFVLDRITVGFAYPFTCQNFHIHLRKTCRRAVPRPGRFGYSLRVPDGIRPRSCRT